MSQKRIRGWNKEYARQMFAAKHDNLYYLTMMIKMCWTSSNRMPWSESYKRLCRTLLNSVKRPIQWWMNLWCFLNKSIDKTDLPGIFLNVYVIWRSDKLKYLCLAFDRSLSCKFYVEQTIITWICKCGLTTLKTGGYSHGTETSGRIVLLVLSLTYY